MKSLAGRAASVLDRCGLLAALEAADRGKDRVRVIAYHRIDEPDAEPDLDPGLISATPGDFREQLEVIARHYAAVSLDDLMAAHRGLRPLPPRAVLLTFDDGYADFASRAWPILREVGLPAVLFVPTAFPDSPESGFWWDRLHSALRRTQEREITDPLLGRLPLDDPPSRRVAHRMIRSRAKALPHDEAMAWLEDLVTRLADVPRRGHVLDWDSLRKLAKEGVSVCSHGHRHALCTRLSPHELALDLSTSRARIQVELGDASPHPVFAYPASGSDGAVRQAVRRAGYEVAFGGRRGIDRIPFADPLDVMRVPVHRYGTALFRAQLRPSVSRLGRALVDGRLRRSA